MSEARSAALEGGAGDARARRNALVLSAAQALFGTGNSILIALGGLAGHMLVEDKSLATLPITTYVLGTALSTVPASFLMRAVGRRNGFYVGASFAALSGFLAAYAIFISSFWLFCLATSFNGVYQAFGQYYRFAAADTASDAFRPKAISWVLAGGLVAAVAGPQIAIYTKELFAPVLFAGAFVASGIAGLAALAVLSFVDIPPQPRRGVDGAAPRPLREVLAQPRLLVAIACGTVSFATMTFVMTAGPLAMVACNHSIDSAAWAIQWHVLAMFAPSFFTGHLIQRFGREPIVLAGLALLAAAGVVGLSGIDLIHFNLALILLGVGWNFGFIGATTMVTDCHRPEERGAVQAVNEFTIFGTVALGSFASGKILNDFGWEAVAWTVLPAVALAAMLLIAQMARSGRTRAAA